MAQSRDPERTEDEVLQEALDDILGLPPGARDGWTPELARDVGPIEHDDNGHVIIDPDACYQHVDCESPYCFPARVVLGSELEDYEADLDFLRREVITLHTNLHAVDAITRFPWEFYVPDGDAYYEWSTINYYQQSVVMAWRLWADDDQNSLTLKRLRTRVMRAVKPQYQAEIRERLKPLDPSRLHSTIVARVHEVRNKRLGHVDRAYHLDVALPKAWPTLSELTLLAASYGDFLHALMFRESQHWVADYVVDSLEWHLDEIALGSDWSRIYDEDKITWHEIIRPKLDDLSNSIEMVEDLNERRKRVGRPAIDWVG